ncbi:MAG: thrombospondin type 3 repeat-containing protein [Solirubrobacteraceae bacterium]|nr:thrombospondin type 3 repeat-containing protein [Solirubrobacteraceae bacterium]
MRRAVLIAVLLTLGVSGEAHAVAGDVKLGCVSSSATAGPGAPVGPGTGACTLFLPPIPGATGLGGGGLADPEVSGDGKNVYAINTGFFTASTAVSTFNRNAVTGALTYASCISGDTAMTGCTQIPSATAGAAGSGLGGVADLTIAPDGKNVYVTSSTDDAVTTFTRNPTTGALSLLECDTGDTAVTPCATLLTATSGGARSALDSPAQLEVSPLNDRVVVTTSADDSVVFFTRDAVGRLTPETCATGDVAVGPVAGGGNGNCVVFPGRATVNGTGSGLDGPGAIAYSPDALNLYVGSTSDDTVMTLSRTSTANGFNFGQCMSGQISMGPLPAGNNRCNLTTGATADGKNSDLDGPNVIVVPPDGLDVIVAAGGSDAVTTFGRSQPPTLPIGALSLTGCVTSKTTVPCTKTPVTGAQSGLQTPVGLAVAPDNVTLYAGVGGFLSTSAQSLTTFARNVTFGTIAFTRCMAADTAAGPSGSKACVLLPSAQPGGLNSGQSFGGGVAVSPDNRNVYITSFADSAITWYGNDADADTVGDVADNCPAAANTNQSDLDADGIGDVCDPTPTPPGPPAGPTPTTPAPAATTPAAGTAKPSKAAPVARDAPFPAQLKVRRASVALRAGRRTLLVEATISGRANGKRITVGYRSSGVTTRRTATVTNGRIRLATRLPATQPLNTGVVTLSLGAAAGLRAQQVTVRAADRSPALKVKEARILNKKLRVAGTISPLATGSVLIRFDFSDKQGNPLSVTAKARIFKGAWKTLQGLEPDARDGGVVTILYPGLARSPLGPLRGEQDARALGVGR